MTGNPSRGNGNGIVLDTAQNTTSQIAHLVANNVTSVLRYLDPLSASAAKVVKPAEAQALASAGIKLALVSEGWGSFAHGAISAMAGERDAQNALSTVPLLGVASGATIYFAVDTDAGLVQIEKLVLPYFASITSAFAASGLSVGVYGSGNVCDLVIANGLAARAWLAGAQRWGGTRAYLAARPPELVLVQHAPSRLANMDVDVNDVLGDFGDFLPFAPAPMSASSEAIPVPATETPNV